jgi:hypothetical protein
MTAIRHRERNLPPRTATTASAQTRAPLPSKEGGGGPASLVGETATVSLDEVLSLANQLTAEERKQVLDLLALKQQVASSATVDRDLEMWVEAVLRALLDALGAEEGAGIGSFLIKRSLGVRSVWGPTRSFFERIRVFDLNVAERMPVYSFLADLLVARCRTLSKRTGAPLGPKLVANCAPDIASIFESAFPGYLAAGLAHVVARQLLRSKT